jgi:predicted nucleic acid-binding protein
MPVLIVDASVTLPWCFIDEATPFTNGLLDRVRNGEEAAVPAHWPVEVLNGLLKAQRRGRISDTDVRQFLVMLGSLPILVEQYYDTSYLESLRVLARKHNLTSYDTAYLELAQQYSLPLATLDQDLRAAAIAEGVKLL